eukprot:242348_1
MSSTTLDTILLLNSRATPLNKRLSFGFLAKNRVASLIVLFYAAITNTFLFEVVADDTNLDGLVFLQEMNRRVDLAIFGEILWLGYLWWTSTFRGYVDVHLPCLMTNV